MNSVALQAALDCMSAAVVLAEGGYRDKAAVAVFEASMATADAAPEGSRLAEALAIVLDAVAQVPEEVAS